MADNWDWTFTSPTFSGIGIVDIVGNHGVSGGGTVTYASVGHSVDFVTGSGSNSLYQWQDDLTPYATPQLPAYPPGFGILFANLLQTVQLNIWYQTDTGSYYGSLSVDGNSYVTPPGAWGEQGTFKLTSVPDGGTTLAFLGLAIAGLAGLRRKLSL